MIHNKVPEKKLLNPRAIRWRKTCPCLTHKQECPFDLSNSVVIMGSPCVLFSRLLGNINSEAYK